MPEPDARLGVAIDDDKLFYALSTSSHPATIERIGQIDFPFDLLDSITKRDPDTFPGLCQILAKMIRDEQVAEARLLFPPALECWSIVPRTVSDQEDEREAHLDILMQGIDTDRIITQWHPVSNRDFRMLSVRRMEHLESFSRLLDRPVNGNLCSDFQLGGIWMKLTSYRGSFMTISSHKGVLGISSYLLGKLRAATYITYDEISDLPYLWLQHSAHLSWLLGMHEQILVYGDRSGSISDTLGSYWDEASEIVILDSLDKMRVTSDEQTYSFPLERAFPAILLSVQ
ncbi:MAG: hypothetical protein ACQETM_02600 [Bacteroidota bacterium]